VGVTRTKENLYIMQPTEEFHYNIGDPILWVIKFFLNK
jgi:hypothetical protein